ncbi:hypothetical protein E1B28_013177 [Marasmius oreades]|uniref:Oxalate decarboxylase n=1 Tax=Marasmius oreades TaxID=181124 RepID=A0A9P7UNR7_9AGAR|nr:uncharacterized protein E1B28_013177 [Marasmius oreades]KAG7087196.1 hypothetical protein E1B28_013177 [Marasmius oreades]
MEISVSADTPTDQQEIISLPFAFLSSGIVPTKLGGGTVKITDSRIFKISTTVAVAEVTVEPGALRKLHWHPSTMGQVDLEDQGRVTVFCRTEYGQYIQLPGG